jgi:predicted O-linked N-acetylglucosamine transferase (SPINDLY family)
MQKYNSDISRALNFLRSKNYESLALELPNLHNKYNDSVEVYNITGLFYISINNYDKALHYFYKGLELGQCPKIYHNMAYIYSNIGSYENCIKYSLMALSLDYTHLISYEMILMNLLYYDKLPDNLYKFRYINPYTRITCYCKDNSIQGYQKFIADLLYNYKYNDKLYTIKKDKINLCYITGDIKDHACSLFINTLITNYDKHKFNIYVYLTDYIDINALENEYKNITFRYILDASISYILDLLKEDNINNVIDLAGYTKGNRMALYSVLGNMKTNIKLYTYMGYPAHIYINNFIRISDVYTEMNNKYTKNYHLMKNFFLCFNYSNDEFVKYIDTYNRASPYKKYKHVLGSFAKLQKINDNVINTWKKIMDSLDSYIFILKNKTFGLDKYKFIWSEKFKGYNVLLLDTNSYEDHLKHYTYLDIQLDTFPYSGTTITCESLFMNTKVITLAGKEHVSRVSASLLNSMSKYDGSFGKLIANTEEEYVKICLKYIKKELPSRRTFLKVMNKTNFMKEFESIFF